MTRLDLYVEVKPVLAGINGAAFHERLQDFGRTCTGALGPVRY
jgi:hypothetical protein